MAHTPDSMSAITAVVFDFGNVICTFSLERLVEELSIRSGLPPDHIAEGLRSSMPLVVEYESGILSSDEFYRRC